MSYFFLSILFVAKQNVTFFPHFSYIHFDFFKFTLRVKCSIFSDRIRNITKQKYSFLENFLSRKEPPFVFFLA